MTTATSGSGEPEHWLFGYGSLMWRPDLPFVARSLATVAGYHRAFCITSTHHRGTEARPGLVLGLDRGGVCHGIAYRIAAQDWPSVLAYLRQRELIYGVYRETFVTALVHDPIARPVAALTYVVERAHPSYAGRLSLDRQLARIRAARGISGANLDYLVNTVRHLGTLGIREPAMERLAALAGGLARRGAPEALYRPSTAALTREWARRPCDARPLDIGARRRFCHRARLGGRAVVAAQDSSISR